VGNSWCPPRRCSGFFHKAVIKAPHEGLGAASCGGNDHEAAKCVMSNKQLIFASPFCNSA